MSGGGNRVQTSSLERLDKIVTTIVGAGRTRNYPLQHRKLLCQASFHPCDASEKPQKGEWSPPLPSHPVIALCLTTLHTEGLFIQSRASEVPDLCPTDQMRDAIHFVRTTDSLCQTDKHTSPTAQASVVAFLGK